MKILIISHEYPPVGGGGANACRFLAERFADRGNSVHVLTADYGGITSPEITYGGLLTVTRVRAKRHSRDSCSAAEMFDYLKEAAKEADRILASEEFDICLCFFGIPGGVLASRLKKKYGLRYVVRMGGGDIPGFQQRFKLLYRIVQPELRMIWKDADALVCNSEGLRELASEFCDKYPIRVIPNGVDTKLYHPAEERNGIETANAEGPDTVQLLTVSRLIARKGMQDLIPEIRWLENRTGRNICWTIAGDGPYRSALEMLASECDVEDRIVFAGRTDGNETAELYRSADIFAFPSYKEGMPNAVLEAMASGLPVVMKRSCQGAAELVRDNGALSDESFADALAEVIEGGRKRWREMGAASRRIVNEEFTWEHISERYLNLLGSIISDE